MDYSSERQAIALPSTSEKGSPYQAVLDASTSPAPPASRKLKAKKALIIFVPLLLISIFLGWMFRTRFHKKHWNTHQDLEQLLWIAKGGNIHQPQHRHHNHRLSKVLYQGLGVEPLDRRLNFPLIQNPDRRCDTMSRWSDPEEISNNDRYNPAPRFSSNATFSFPLSEPLLLYALGRHSTGDIVFVDDNAESGDIVVDLNVRYWSQEDLDQAQICTLHRSLGAKGLGIFTPTDVHRGAFQDELVFKIFVRFPKSSDDNPVHVKNLQTILPMFTHEFPKANMHFDTLSVMTSYFPIRAESLSLKSGRLQTKNSEITGNYTVTDYLDLQTMNGFLLANVTMNNTGKGTPTRLSISSNSSPVIANVSLFSNEATGGDFVVNANNFNAALYLQFPTAPIDHVLYLSAHGYHAWVDLPPTYEGAFDILTPSTTARPRIQVAEGLEDPKSEGRTRHITVNSTRREISGNVSWTGDTDSFDRGSVEISTHVLQALLSL